MSEWADLLITFFESVLHNHCWAALDLVAGIEQPFDSPIVQNPRTDPGGRLGDLPPKTYESNFFIMILYKLENNIGDLKPFFLPLLCHSSVMKYTSSLLQ